MRPDTLSYAVHACGTRREPRDHGASHVGVGMSELLGGVCGIRKDVIQQNLNEEL